MPFKEGQVNNPKGRGKGVKNKITLELRDMIVEALEKAGGVKYLLKQSKDNPKAFLTLLSKVLPKDVNVSGSLSHTIKDEPVPEFNRFIAGIATRRIADKKPPSLPN